MVYSWANFFWSVALITKVQVQPFWAASLLVSWSVVLYRKNWWLAGLVGAGFMGSALLAFGLQQLFLQLYSSHSEPIPGLFRAVAIVLVGPVRWSALWQILLFGIPTLLGLAWGVWSILRSAKRFQTHTEIVRLAVLVLAGSWFTWFLTLAMNWPRYLWFWAAS